MNKNCVKINEYHHYDKANGFLYLNEKELYLSKNELKLFSILFESFNEEVSYEQIDLKESIRPTVVSNLNLKLKGIIVRNVRATKSIILTFK